MGTYRQPASLVDTQSGEISRQATKEGFAAINAVAAISIAQADKREKQEKEMTDAEKKIWEVSTIAQAKGNAALNNNHIDNATLGTGVNDVTKAQANARIENLSLSTSDSKYHKNLTIIGNSQQFLIAYHLCLREVFTRRACYKMLLIMVLVISLVSLPMGQ